MSEHVSTYNDKNLLQFSATRKKNSTTCRPWKGIWYHF